MSNYHIVSMHCDLVIECDCSDPLDAVDWWLANEAQEAVQMQIHCTGRGRINPQATRAVVLTPRCPQPPGTLDAAVPVARLAGTPAQAIDPAATAQ